MRLLTAVAALSRWAVPALAQQQQGPVCLPFKDAIKAAFDRFNEVPSFVMVAANGAVLTMTVAEDGNWTLWIQATADDMCVVATGNGFGPASDAVKALAVPGEGA